MCVSQFSSHRRAVARASSACWKSCSAVSCSPCSTNLHTERRSRRISSMLGACDSKFFNLASICLPRCTTCSASLLSCSHRRTRSWREAAWAGLDGGAGLSGKVTPTECSKPRSAPGGATMNFLSSGGRCARTWPRTPTFTGGYYHEAFSNKVERNVDIRSQRTGRPPRQEVTLELRLLRDNLAVSLL